MQTLIAKRESFLAPKEVADALGVHAGAVYRAVDRGELPVVRLGQRGAIRIPVSALEPGPRP
jgi:excisionase family DNA binding protein